jgi:hypothetical protein
MTRRNFDRKLTAMMVNDFIHDPILASKVILGWSIPPHQQIRIMTMWTSGLTIDDSGFSTGKTATLAAIMVLRSILFSGRMSGIVSGTFRQSKIIFRYIDSWYQTSSIVRHSILHSRGSPKITHSTDVHEAIWTNGSIVRALPPGFSSESSKLRSERWHDGYFDEWTTFDIPTLTKTLFGRVTAINFKQKDPIYQNHIHLSSTPSFEVHPSYSLVKTINDEIDSGNKNYKRFTCNFRHIPYTKKWNGFVSYNSIAIMQKTNPKGIVNCEINGLWTKDSMSYYSFNDIYSVRMVNSIELKKDKDSIYFAGFDSARGGTTKDSQNSGSGDDFAISILKLKNGRLPATHVYTLRYNNIKSDQMASIVYRLNDLFSFIYITYDPAGGGVFVVDELSKSELLIDGSMKSIIPIVDATDFITPMAQRILIPFKRGSDLLIKGLDISSCQSESILINKAHDVFKRSIENKDILLMNEWNGWPTLRGPAHVKKMRNWLNKNDHLMSEKDRIKANADLAVNQIVLIDIERDKNGIPLIDRYGMYKFISTGKNKKDAAYSIMYANVGLTCYLRNIKRNERERGKKVVFSSGAY